MKNGLPRMIYNLNYSQGPKILSMKNTDQIFDNEDLNIRFGVVGGVAGFAIKEIVKSVVEPIENDHYLKSKSVWCPECEFNISNEVYIGGTDINKLSDGYNGCIELDINHKKIKLSDFEEFSTHSVDCIETLFKPF